MDATEAWPNLTHQMRDRLHALCQQAGVSMADKWLSEAACEAIEKLTAEKAAAAAEGRGRAAALVRSGEFCRRADHAQGACRCDELAAAILAPG